MIELRIRSRNASEIEFNTRVDRFKNVTKPLYQVKLGPGRYAPKRVFEEDTNNKKPNLLFSKSERLGKTGKKYPDPGEYQISIEWNKQSFNLLKK